SQAPETRHRTTTSSGGRLRFRKGAVDRHSPSAYPCTRRRRDGCSLVAAGWAAAVPLESLPYGGAIRMGPAHQLYRLGPVAGFITGRQNARIHPGRLLVSNSRSDLRDAASKRRTVPGHARSQAQIRSVVFSRWFADRVYGSGRRMEKSRRVAAGWRTERASK